MIWRQTYESTVSYNEEVPILQTQTLTGEDFTWPEVCVLLVSSGFDGLVEQNVWWKLHEEDFPKSPNVFRAFANLSAQQPIEVELMVAPSQRPNALLISGEFGAWFDPDNPSRSFAGIFRGGTVVLAVRGLPTEDCWEEFSNRLKLELDGPRGG